MIIAKALSSLWSKLNELSTIGTLYRLGLFLILYFLGRYIIIFLEEPRLFTSLFASIHQPFLWCINKVSTGFLGLCYHNLLSTSDYIISINNIEIIQLLPGCSGFHPILRLTFILLFFPIPWRTKSWLFPLSWLIILLAATIHFILLFLIANHWPEYYSFSHNWLTRIIFYGFYFLIWLIWERVGYPKKKMMRDAQSAKHDK